MSCQPFHPPDDDPVALRFSTASLVLSCQPFHPPDDDPELECAAVDGPVFEPELEPDPPELYAAPLDPP
jgi:hypothetical protein